MNEKLVNPGESVFLLAGEVALDKARSWRVTATDHFPDGATLCVEAASDGSLKRVVTAGFVPPGQYREDDVSRRVGEVARIERLGAGGPGYGSSAGSAMGAAGGVGGPFAQSTVLGFGHVYGSDSARGIGRSEGSSGRPDLHPVRDAGYPPLPRKPKGLEDRS